MRLSAEDHAKVTAAVAEAELRSSGEIVTVVARRSDNYNDVAAHAGVFLAMLTLAVLALFPGIALWIDTHLHDPWAEHPSPAALLTIAFAAAALAFLLGRFTLAHDGLRIALTPKATRARRVRARALTLFRSAVEQRTLEHTGVLLYLSLAEHRAELIADVGIHSKVPPETWGAAMAALVSAVKDGRVGDGMAQAVRQIGDVLAQHFPRAADDQNELPDRLIEL